MRCRYSIRSRAEQRDARGERASKYIENFKVWGEPPREGTTSIASGGGGQVSEETLRFRIRFHPDVEVGDQAVDVGTDRVYYIQSVTDVPGGYRLYLQLVVTQSPAEGS